MDTQLTPKKQAEILVTTTGEIRAIHSDAIMPVLENLGTVTMRRASHVEPASGIRPEAAAWLKNFYASMSSVDPTKALELRDHKRIRWQDGIITHIDGREQWYADLLPSAGPVIGPCDSKQAALDAEVAWLSANGFPCGDTNCPGPVCGELGPEVFVVAYDGHDDEGFEWHTTLSAALQAFDAALTSVSRGTTIYRFAFKHGGIIACITSEIANVITQVKSDPATIRQVV